MRQLTYISFILAASTAIAAADLVTRLQLLSRVRSGKWLCHLLGSRTVRARRALECVTVA